MLKIFSQLMKKGKKEERSDTQINSYQQKGRGGHKEVDINPDLLREKQETLTFYEGGEGGEK